MIGRDGGKPEVTLTNRKWRTVIVKKVQGTHKPEVMHSRRVQVMHSRRVHLHGLSVRLAEMYYAIDNRKTFSIIYDYAMMHGRFL